MCGFPSSGKTQIADKLRIYFEGERGKIVHFIGDDSIGIDRNVTYASKSQHLTSPHIDSYIFCCIPWEKQGLNPNFYQSLFSWYILLLIVHRVLVQTLREN